MKIECIGKTEKTLKDLIRERDRLMESRYVQLAIKADEMRDELEDEIETLKELEMRGREIEESGVDTDILLGLDIE